MPKAAKANSKKAANKTGSRRRTKLTGTRSAIIPVNSETRETTNKNATTANPLPGDPSTITAHVQEYFSTVAAKFEANKGYGRQHINSNGCVHPDGVLTKGNVALVKLASQAMEVLCQRAALVGNKEAESRFDETSATPKEAKQLIGDMIKFLQGRVKEIQSHSEQSVLNEIAKDLGLEGADKLVPAPKKR